MAGGNRNQTIHVVMTTASADATSQRFVTNEGKRARERATNDQKAAQDSENAFVRATYKMMAASKQLADQKDRDRKKDLAEQKAADDAYVRGIRRRVNAENRIAQESAAFRSKTDREAAAASVAANKEVDALFAWGMRDRTATLKREIGDQARAAAGVRKTEMAQMAATHKLAMMQWKFQQDATKEQELAANATKTAVLGYIGAFAGIGVVVAGLKAIAEYWDNVRRDTIASVREVLHMRDAVLELAALKDKLGQTGPVLGEQLLLRSETGMKQQAANEFQTHFLGRAEAAIGKTVDAKDAQELAITMGKLQMLEGSNAAAYGDLAGAIAMTAKKGTTGRELSGQADKLYQIQKPGAFASVSQFAGQYSKAAGLVQNDIYTGPELAALLSMQSEYGPEEAETRVSQMTRLAASGLMRARHIKGAPGIEHDTSAEFFKKAGITQGMKGMERLERLSDFMIAEQDQATKAGKPYMLREEILRHGVINSDDAEALENFIGAKRSGIWKGFTDIRDAKNNPDVIAATHADRRRKDPSFMNETAKLAEDLADVARASSPEGGLEPLQRVIYAKRKGEGKTVGTFEAWKDAGLWKRTVDDLTDPSGKHGAHFGVNQEVQEELIEQAKALGVDYRKTLGFTKYKDKGGRRPGVDPDSLELYAGDERVFALHEQITSAGGNTLESVQQRAAEGNATLLRQEDLMKQIVKNTQPGGAPPGGPARRGNGMPLRLAPKAMDGLRQAGAF
jgi:hypothetical protein